LPGRRLVCPHPAKCSCVVHMGRRSADILPGADHRFGMTTTAETVRLSGRLGLLAAVPALLGFHPEESVVMICLSGPRRRVGPVIRIDLADLYAAGRASATVGQLQAYARRHADEVAVLCFTEHPEPQAELHGLIAALQRSGTAILDAALVRSGRAYPVAGPGRSRPANCTDAVTDLPTMDDPQFTAMAAASILSGRGILANRQALRTSIAGPSGTEAVKASAALHAAADGLFRAVGSAGSVNHLRLRRMADVAVQRALAQAAASGVVDTATSASLVLLLCDAAIRDHLIAEAVDDLQSSWLPMLIAVARSVPDDHAAEVCAVLAVAAYRRGDGALAQVAVDRCLAAVADHRLAHLMLGVMAAGLPPADLVRLANEATSSGTDG